MIDLVKTYKVHIFCIITVLLLLFVIFSMLPEGADEVEVPDKPAETIVADITKATEETACKKVPVYLDSDGDSWGSMGAEYDICEQEETPLGYTTKAGDCNDQNASIWRGITVYEDRDEDGHSADISWTACTNNQVPKGWVANLSDPLDCNDRHDQVYPGSLGTEFVGGLDLNCDGFLNVARGIIFVTDARYNGDLGGLSGADSICQSTADAEGLIGTWTAFLSTSEVDAIDRVDEMAFMNGRGVVIATNKSDLTKGWIADMINYDEKGGKSYNDVWTGSESDATVSQSGADKGACHDWESNGHSYQGVYGATRAATAHWINRDKVQCDNRKSLYCVKTA